MKYRYVFLLGRAACGKSALYRQLKVQLLASGQAESLERLDDFPRLWARFTADDDRDAKSLDRRWTARTEDGGYVLTDLNLLNEILVEVNDDLQLIDKPGHMVFVEFARSSYFQAIQHFDSRILANSLIVYVQVSFETCWARNVARHNGIIGGGSDDHMRARCVPTIIIDNVAEGEEHLRLQVKKLIDRLF